MAKNAAQFDIEAWIKETIPVDKLDEATRNAVYGVLKDPAAVDKIQAGQMRQSEFSKRMNDWQAETAAAKQAAEEAQAKYQAELQKLSQWEADGNAEIAKYADAAKAAEKQRLETEAALRKLQKEYELSDDDLGLKLENQPVNNAPAFDASKYMTVEQAQKLINQNNLEVAKVMTEYPAKLHGLVRRHSELFPGELLDIEGLYNDFRKTNKPLDQLWEEKYKIPEKRAEIAEAAIQKREADAEQRGYKKAMESMNAPVSSFDPSGARSPALRQFGAQGEGLKPAEQLSGVDKAMRRFEQFRADEFKASQARKSADAA